MLKNLEIDVMQANELEEASQITSKYKLPAMVIHPDLSSEAYIIRAQLKSNYKLITPVDWPRGVNNGILKMRGLSTDALEVEGFEILLTGYASIAESKKEIEQLTEFIRTHLSEIHEIRLVLGTTIRSIEEITNMCEAIKLVRKPSMIRNDTNLKLQVNKANSDIHIKTIEFINNIIKAPIKIAGNINNFKSVIQCRKANRFSVNLLQAKSIIKEYKSQPADELRKLLYDE